MNLYYIHLGLDYYDYIESNNELRYEFQRHTNFIDDYFSKKIRKEKFKTDGTFKMIAVSPTEFEIKPNSLVPMDVLEVNLPFDRNRYEKIKGTEDCNYYLELLEQGFKKASEYKSIPLEYLLGIVEDFKQGGCKNEWLHKKKRFKEEDLEVNLICEFTTNYFQLVIVINQISIKKELVKGVVIRTEAGVSIHEGMYKDILILADDIIITDKTYSPRIVIDRKKTFVGILNYKILGDKELRRMLSYKG
ncbi:MAG: hypothetical protein H6Q15_712 [Bacteroidetes bacterium]|nr:hypothetical protein [Bacteroidota bacterium]